MKMHKRDIVTRRNVLCLTVRLNQPAGGTIDCTIHALKYVKPFPSKFNTPCTQRLKNISEWDKTFIIKALNGSGPNGNCFRNKYLFVGLGC